MCGIAGLLDRRLVGCEASLAAHATAMADAIAHRGPDGWGVWVDADAGIALSHRRLAVIDLTPAGRQPMQSADGRWIISYNGEVYNAAALAAMPEFGGVAWRGTSDTEVILESIARCGLDATLAALNGMFAFALWDRTRRELHLVRDRIGIKPLFFAAGAGGCRFASELKSLLAVEQAMQIDPASIASFLRFGYVPAPHTIFSGVAKVRPGEIVTIAADGRVSRRPYWSLAAAARDALAHPLAISDAEAIVRLEAVLAEAVAAQMISDVPLGAFLSGGIDSSTVVALMTASGRGPVRTFSIGFPDFGFDESAHAAAVARHLGTRHEQMIVTGADAVAVVPQLAEIYDEPFADSSQIPTLLVAKLTRRHVTVALSGDGGDELFAGYNRYRLAEWLGTHVLAWPQPVRRGLARLLAAIPPGLIDRAAGRLPARFVPPQPGDKLGKAAEILPLDAEGLYLRLVSQCADPAAFGAGPEHPLSWRWNDSFASGTDRMRQMQLLDLATYLPDDILQKVDRASMAFALEVRPPLLDHRVVEFALRLPVRLRRRHGESKWLLRRVLERHVPRHLVTRPKMGFAVPLAAWLRGPLRDWGEALLDRQRFGGGLLDPDAARRLWEAHLSGTQNAAYALWTLLSFEAWRRRWMPAAPVIGKRRPARINF
jgi:asparagine synthase (glutamine-hydrolysing)